MALGLAPMFFKMCIVFPPTLADGPSCRPADVEAPMVPSAVDVAPNLLDEPPSESNSSGDAEPASRMLAPRPAEWDEHVDWLLQGGDDAQSGVKQPSVVAVQPTAFRAEEAELDDVFAALRLAPASAPASSHSSPPPSAPNPLRRGEDKDDLAFLYEDSGDDADPDSGPRPPRPPSSARLSGMSRRPASNDLSSRSPYLPNAGVGPDRTARPASQGQSKRFFPRRPVEGAGVVRRSAVSRPRTVSPGAQAAGSDSAADLESTPPPAPANVGTVEQRKFIRERVINAPHDPILCALAASTLNHGESVVPLSSEASAAAASLAGSPTGLSEPQSAAGSVARTLEVGCGAGVDAVYASADQRAETSPLPISTAAAVEAAESSAPVSETTSAADSRAALPAAAHVAAPAPGLDAHEDAAVCGEKPVSLNSASPPEAPTPPLERDAEVPLPAASAESPPVAEAWDAHLDWLLADDTPSGAAPAAARAAMAPVAAAPPLLKDCDDSETEDVLAALRPDKRAPEAPAPVPEVESDADAPRGSVNAAGRQRAVAESELATSAAGSAQAGGSGLLSTPLPAIPGPARPPGALWKPPPPGPPPQQRFFPRRRVEGFGSVRRGNRGGQGAHAAAPAPAAVANEVGPTEASLAAPPLPPAPDAPSRDSRASAASLLSPTLRLATGFEAPGAPAAAATAPPAPLRSLLEGLSLPEDLAAWELPPLDVAAAAAGPPAITSPAPALPPPPTTPLDSRRSIPADAEAARRASTWVSQAERPSPPSSAADVSAAEARSPQAHAAAAAAVAAALAAKSARHDSSPRAAGSGRGGGGGWQDTLEWLLQDDDSTVDLARAVAQLPPAAPPAAAAAKAVPAPPPADDDELFGDSSAGLFAALSALPPGGIARAPLGGSAAAAVAPSVPPLHSPAVAATPASATAAAAAPARGPTASAAAPLLAWASAAPASQPGVGASAAGSTSGRGALGRPPSGAALQRSRSRSRGHAGDGAASGAPPASLRSPYLSKVTVDGAAAAAAGPLLPLPGAVPDAGAPLLPAGDSWELEDEEDARGALAGGGRAPSPAARPASGASGSLARPPSAAAAAAAFFPRRQGRAGSAGASARGRSAGSGRRLPTGAAQGRGSTSGDDDV